MFDEADDTDNAAAPDAAEGREGDGARHDADEPDLPAAVAQLARFTASEKLTDEHSAPAIAALKGLYEDTLEGLRQFEDSGAKARVMRAFKEGGEAEILRMQAEGGMYFDKRGCARTTTRKATMRAVRLIEHSFKSAYAERKRASKEQAREAAARATPETAAKATEAAVAAASSCPLGADPPQSTSASTPQPSDGTDTTQPRAAAAAATSKHGRCVKRPSLYAPQVVTGKKARAVVPKRGSTAFVQVTAHEGKSCFLGVGDVITLAVDVSAAAHPVKLTKKMSGYETSTSVILRNNLTTVTGPCHILLSLAQRRTDASVATDAVANVAVLGNDTFHVHAITTVSLVGAGDTVDANANDASERSGAGGEGDAGGDDAGSDAGGGGSGGGGAGR